MINIFDIKKMHIKIFRIKQTERWTLDNLLHHHQQQKHDFFFAIFFNLNFLSHLFIFGFCDVCGHTKCQNDANNWK